MSNYFNCPFCNSTMPIIGDTVTTYYCDFNKSTDRHHYYFNNVKNKNETLTVSFYKCPRCNEISVVVYGIGENYANCEFPIRPISYAKQFPEYVPLKIRQDYEEACAIVNLSPKSSATLSRRCLQAMINDFWKIKENRLVTSINQLQNKVPATQWKVIDAIRKIGNIGAHPELDINTIIDIEPEDAKKLIKIIELLINQWYIEKHEQEQLYQDILQIKDDKEKQRKSKE